MDASRDGNFVTTLLGVSSVDLTTPTTVAVNPVTHRVLVDSSGGGTGTVTSVSVTAANGFSGTVATPTTTPAITLQSTLNTAILASNGTALIAATTTGSGSTAVLQTSPALITPDLGTPTALVGTNITGTASGLSIGGNAATATLATTATTAVTAGSAASLITGRTIAITGDLAYTSPSFNGTANVTAAGTLATVNGTVGTFTNATVTVNGKGLITNIANGSAGSGGTAIMLNPSDAVLPDTNFAAPGRTVGTNYSYNTLDFDQTTSEACYWNVAIPATPTTSAKVGIWWTASAGTGTFTADLDWRSVTNDEVLDATTTPSVTNDTGTDTLLATGDLHYFEVALTSATSAIVAGDLLMIKFSRDVADTLSGDAKVIKIQYIAS